MANWKKRVPYQLKLAMSFTLFSTILLLICCPIYIHMARPKWVQEELAVVINKASSTTLLISRQLNAAESKVTYAVNDNAANTLLANIQSLSLVQSLDLIETLSSLASSLCSDTPGMVLRWYPYETAQNYGRHCYSYAFFENEYFSNNAADTFDLNAVRSLKKGDMYWTARTISRDTNNIGLSELRLCCYAKIENANNSDCILELSFPVRRLISIVESDSPAALFLYEEDQKQIAVFESSLSQSEQLLLAEQYRQTGSIKGYEIITNAIPGNDKFHIVTAIPKTYVSQLLFPKYFAFFAVILLILVILMCVAYVVAHMLTRHILTALDTINGDLSSFANDQTQWGDNQDIAQVVQRVKKLIQTTQSYYVELKNAEINQQRMELDLLQLRFNPHLLYNTLGAIQCQVSSPAICNTIDSLCNYYRIVLNNGHTFICIRDEMNMVHEYLQIMKYAYQLDQISFEISTDPAIENHSVIKHILQPIAENALHHGLRPAAHAGLLQIFATKMEDCVLFQITDNGVGISQEKIKQLLSEPPSGCSQGGYGIYNVQQRIHSYYGQAYGIEIQSKEGIGTTVNIRIPLSDTSSETE